MKMCEKCVYYKVKSGSFRKTCCKAEIEEQMSKRGEEWLVSPQDYCFDVWVDHTAKMAMPLNEDFSENELAYLIRHGNSPTNFIDFDYTDEDIII